MHLNFRKANKEDVILIVEMLADDELGKLRENYSNPLPLSYYAAFEKINEDKNQELIVVENHKMEVIGTLQLSFIPYLTHNGGLRAQIEAVRIKKKFRDKGFGKKFFLWAIAKAKEKGAHVLQLSTDKKRLDTIRFYEKLGFKASHEGMKLNL